MMVQAGPLCAGAGRASAMLHFAWHTQHRECVLVAVHHALHGPLYTLGTDSAASGGVDACTPHLQHARVDVGARCLQLARALGARGAGA
jgi:hypothetical protein